MWKFRGAWQGSANHPYYRRGAVSGATCGGEKLCGVGENIYLFARLGFEMRLRGSDCIHELAKHCGTEKSEAVIHKTKETSGHSFSTEFK